jgi:hypothetical protein
MSSRSVASLHVTNGDAVIYAFKKAGILGTHLPWRDVLHEGPVPATALEHCSKIRGAYLASRGFGKAIKIFHDLQSRDAVIRRAGEFDEVVLWFEHDLYDQLQILQILSVLGEMRLDPGRVSMVQSDAYLGSMTAEEIVALYPKRRTVTAALYERARALWDTFTGSDPSSLAAECARDHAGFPHMRAALKRLLEEFPSVRDGLSRSQRNALAAVAQGPGRSDELFRRAQAREEAPFLGDTTFGAILADLRFVSAPLVDGSEGELVPTPLGQRVLAGEDDWLRMHAIDRWIGGVNVSKENDIRWDEARETLLGHDAARNR